MILDAWHFTGPTLRDGTSLPEDGKTLRIDGEPVLCGHGYHASERALDALTYAAGATLCRVRLSGQIIEDSDKAVATERTVLWRVDGEALLRRFARWCALDVIGLWEPPDVVGEYLRTGQEDLRAAAKAAASADAWGAAEGAAARAAARAAAWHAAWGAAEDAATDAALHAVWGAAEAAFAASFAAYNAASAADVNADWHAAWRAAWHAAARAADVNAASAADAAAHTRQERRLRAMIHAERRSTE